MCWQDCSCCRESAYKERTVRLERCYDQDGIRLTGSLATMQVSHSTEQAGLMQWLQVTIKEPAGCECFSCGSPLPR